MKAFHAYSTSSLAHLMMRRDVPMCKAGIKRLLKSLGMKNSVSSKSFTVQNPCSSNWSWYWSRSWVFGGGSSWLSVSRSISTVIYYTYVPGAARKTNKRLDLGVMWILNTLSWYNLPPSSWLSLSPFVCALPHLRHLPTPSDLVCLPSAASTPTPRCTHATVLHPHSD